MRGFVNCPKHGKTKTVLHHIIPRSRGGKPGTTAEVCGKCEKIYHELFGVMTPDEILLYLTQYFWKPKGGRR